MAASYWICLFFALSAAAQAATDQTAVTIGGRVVNSETGEVIRKAEVTLAPTAERKDSALVATTDDAGLFRFANITDGLYRLTVEKEGFVAGGYGETKPDDELTLLKIKAGDRMQDITLRLFPGGTISGRVLDPDGDPLPEAQVIGWTKHLVRGEMTSVQSIGTVTNSAGEYRMEGLKKGTYYVSTDPESWGRALNTIPVDRAGNPTKMRELVTYFPGTMAMDDAQPIHIEGGQEQSGIDIRIQRGPVLSVKGRIAGITNPVSKYELSGTVPMGFGWSSISAKMLPNGDFTVEGLAPGKHTLTLLENGPNGSQIIAETELVLADQDVTGVVITPFKPAELRVRVVREGDTEDTPLTAGSVFLVPLTGPRNKWNNGSAYEPQNGIYSMHSVRPGKYQLMFTNAPACCYLKSVESGGRSLDPESIDIAENANLDLLVTYSPNVATVTGDVEVPPDRPPGSFHVLRIEEDTASGQDKVHSVNLDQSFHFSIERLRPAKYLLFAVEDEDSELWSNSNFVKLMQDNAAAVELHEKQQATVHLKIVSKEVTDRMRQQLGL